MEDCVWREKTECRCESTHNAGQKNYTGEIVDQFRNWETGKSTYLWRRRVEMVLPHLPALGSVLDAGCGDGSTIGFFAQHRPDLAFYGADMNRLKLRRFLRAEVRRLPFQDNAFNAVTLLAVIEHVPEHDDAIQEISRVLKPGGLLLVTTPNPLYGLPMAIAGRIGLKYREGYDNSVSITKLERLASQNGFYVEESLGFLAAPIPSFLERFEESLGRHRFARKILLNQFVKARKK